MRKKPVLLFVDDEERIIKLLGIMFRSEYEVHTALSAKEALAIMETHDVDVIASDQRMPGKTGIELLSEVRQRWPRSVRILLTGYSDLVAIIGAVNEGEVFRFLNKPWNQAELRAVIAEAAELAQKAPVASAGGAATDPAADTADMSQLSIATKLLAVDGVATDRQEVVEMFTRDYNVLAAANMAEALEIIRQQDVGVIVTSSEIDGQDVGDALARIAEVDPAITVVAMTAHPDSDVIIRLINQGRIYRFAMKPLSPNVFRLAVSAAMREHHRRLADPRIVRQPMPKKAAEDDAPANPSGFFETMVRSLGRFTKVG